MQAVVARERAALISKHGRNDIDVPDLVMHPCTRMCSCRLNFVTPFTTGALVLPLLCLRFLFRILAIVGGNWPARVEVFGARRFLSAQCGRCA